ncbi:MAG TPA: LPS export ABC transporter permease LptF [Xanthobacteraceae bacterium]|nr:LPS export ABC transporter permease LptF [Xanthobacteraceae bacterium]
MASIDRYIFRTIFGGFLLILINLTMVIWITQILRQVDLITNQGQTILVFLRITGLLVPILTMVIAPIAIVIAVCYALLRLNGDSELVVMNAAGISPRRAFVPVLASCIIVAIFVAYVSAFLAPWLQRKMAAEIAKVRTDVVANIVRPGAFTSVDRGLIFHIRERRGENQFQGVFIDDTRLPEERTTIVAEYGQIVQRGDSAFLVMREGNVQRRRAKERDPAIVVFDQYAFDLTRLAPAPQVNVGLREKYVWELAFPAADDSVMKLSPSQFRVELHERLFAPLYPLAFGVIAFAILGFPRTTRQSRAVSMFAVIAAVSVLRLGGFAGTAIAVTTPAMLAVVYAMILGAVVSGGFVIWRGIPIDLDEKLDFGVAARAGVLRLERIAARFHVRLPTNGILRRLDHSD